MLERIKKISLGNWIIIGGCIITICSIFCFFGKGVYYANKSFSIGFESSLFDYMLGSNDAYLIYKLTIVFSFQLAISILCILTIIFIFYNSSKKLITILSSISGIAMLTMFILVLCTKSMLLSAVIEEARNKVPELLIDVVIDIVTNDIFPDVHLSAGPISFAIMGSISFVTFSVGIFFLNKDFLKTKLKIK